MSDVKAAKDPSLADILTSAEENGEQIRGLQEALLSTEDFLLGNPPSDAGEEKNPEGVPSPILHHIAHRINSNQSGLAGCARIASRIDQILR